MTVADKNGGLARHVRRFPAILDESALPARRVKALKYHCRARLPAQQQPARLLDGRSRILRKLLVRRIADRMADNCEFVVRHAQHPAHHLSRADETFRHHADGGDALPFSRDGVVQTAR